MARQKLGIDVEIKYPTIREMQQDLASKWKSVKDGQSGDGYKIKISADENSLKSTRKRIQDYLDKSEIKFKFKSDIGDVMFDIDKVKKEITSLHTLLEKELKLQLSASSKKDLKEMFEEMSKLEGKAKKESSSGSGSPESQRLSRIKDIVKHQKELNSLMDKQDKSGSSAYNARIATLRDEIGTLKDLYNEEFKVNADNHPLMQAVEEIGKMNSELQKAKAEQDDINEGYKKAVTLLNEIYSIEKQIENTRTGEKEKGFLREQLEEAKSIYAEHMKSNDLIGKMSDTQKASLNTMVKENEELKIRNRLKQEDAQQAQALKEATKDMKSQLRDILKIESQISELKAKQDAGVATSKEADRLFALEKEKSAREDVYETTKRLHNLEGESARTLDDSLDAMRKQHDTKQKIADAQNEANVELMKTNKYYDEIKGSIKEVQRLTDRLADAGENERRVIERAIDAEQEKQKEIREQLALHGRINQEREQEIDLIQRQQREQNELNNEMAEAKQIDGYNDNSTIGMLEPDYIFDKVRDGAMKVYEIIAPIDEQMINLEKVLEANDAQWDKFSTNMFDYASNLGVTTDMYLEAVERWGTAGFDLQQSKELADASTLGSFVGNVGGAEMVDFMSVPLVAYKDTALEVGDILNAMNEVANQNAIEMEHLGEAYKIASGTAATAGTSFEELTGLITAGQEATRRGGQVVGTSLRAIDINFSNMSAQLTAENEKRFAFFNGIGVEIQDAEGVTRSTYEVLKDLSGVWDDLSKQDQQTAITYAGGKQHASTLQGIITNWEVVAKATGEAREQTALFDKESGSAYKEFETQTNSVEFAVANLKNSISEMVMNLVGGRQGVIDIVNTLGKYADIARSLSENKQFVEFLKVALSTTLWLSANVAIGKVARTLGGGLTSSLSLLSGKAEGVVGMLGRFFGIFGGKSKDAVKSSSGLISSFGSSVGKLGGVISKGVPLIGGFITTFMILDTVLESLTGFDLSGWAVDQIGGLAGSFNKYSEELGRNAEAVDELREANDKYESLQKSNPLLNGQIENANELVDKYKELIKLKEEDAKIQSEESGIEVGIELNETEYFALKNEVNAFAEEMGFIGVEIEINDIEHIKSEMDELERRKNALEVSSMQEYSSTLKERNESLGKVEYSSRSSEQRDSLNEEYKQAVSEANAKYGLLLDGGKKLNEEMEKISREYETRQLELSVSFGNYLMNSGFFETDSFKKGSEERIRAIQTQQDMVSALYKSLDEINVSSFGDDKEGAKLMAQELATGTYELDRRKVALQEVNNLIEQGGEVTTEEYLRLSRLVPEIEAWGNDTAKWNQNVIQETLAGVTTQSEGVSSKIADLLKWAGEDVERFLSKMTGDATDFISLMSTFGETGALALAIPEETMALYDGNIEKIFSDMINLQKQVEELDQETIVKFNLVTDDGLVNWDAINAVNMLPPEVIQKFGLQYADGSLNLENVSNLLGAIDEVELEKFVIDGEFNYDKFINYVNDNIENGEYKDIFVEANIEELKKDIAKAKEIADEVTEKKRIVDVSADARPLHATMDSADERLNGFDGRDVTTYFSGNMTRLEWINQKVKEIEYDRTVNVTFDGWMSDRLAMLSNTLRGGFTSPVAIGASVAITNPNMGRSFSAGISNSLGSSSSVSATSRAVDTRRNYNYDDDRPPAKVSEEVWRYWSKELFEGLPLEKALNNLNDSVTKAKDDNRKLIELYKKQIAQADKQIKYEQQMKGLQQSEMNTILSQLRGYGFKNSGNRITNLGIAKNLSGDKASEASELLNRYKSLYESINALDRTISGLNMDKFGYNQNIESAKEAIEAEKQRLAEEKIAKELEKIEGRLKKTEALLTNISNDTELFGTKLGFAGDGDFELKMTLSEEGINKSSSNIKSLSDEFNNLSKMYIENSDNAESVKSQLETLRTNILSNADAVLQYRESIKQMELDRFTSDFAKFGNVVSSNVSRISNNIDMLREGLTSGQTLGGLRSSSLMGIDFTRKSQLEKQYEERLKLEAELNQAMDGFAKKNIERSQKVANSVLDVEYKKYSNLLKMANEYSNGKVASASISQPATSIGSTSSQSSKSGKEYQSWLNTLSSINDAYTKQYAQMVKKYDDAMSKAKTNVEREALTNSVIIEQMKLQESIYGSIIKVNDKAISQSKELLNSGQLTTEQREDILSSIEEYEKSNIDAQTSIRDSVKSRFDLEFQLIDESIEKVGEYSQGIDQLLSIAQAVNADDTVIGKIYETIFGGKANELSRAKEIIKQLTSEQSKFLEGSLEWSLLGDKIKDVEGNLGSLTIELLEANQNILNNQLDMIQKASEKSVLGGRTLEEWKKYRSDWLEGIEKELELDKIRGRLSLVEDKTLQSRLELMDRQEKLSKAELDYLDKQLGIVELQEKLANIQGQRNVQTLARDERGNWQWQYVADQTAYDETNAELKDAQVELEKFRKQQQEAYVSAMNDIVEKARNGEYSSEDGIRKDISNINSLFDDILGDSMRSYDTNAILDAYRSYIGNNIGVVGDFTGSQGGEQFISNLGKTFENSFINVSLELGKVIGEELKRALTSTPLGKDGSRIAIDNMEFNFPNVRDKDGILQAFEELPQIAKQIVTNK